MDKEIIINETVKLNREIEDFISGFSNNPYDISSIEIDLTLEKLRRLYDMIRNLNRDDLNNIASSDTKDDDASQQVIYQPENEEKVVRDKDEETGMPEKAVHEFVDPEVKSVEEKSAKAEQKTTEANSEKQPKQVSGPDSQKAESKPEVLPAGATLDLFGETMAEKLAINSDKTVADSISEKIEEKSIADVIQKTAVSDLKDAIGINEKFYFINELFEGNMKEYNDTIDKLNGFNGNDEALAYLNELVEKYQWKADNEAVVQLKELVERRYL